MPISRAIPVLSFVLAVALAHGPVHAQLLTSGQYTGNGIDDRGITGVGFAPDIIILKRDGGSHAYCRSSTMSGDVSKSLPSGEDLKDDRIQSLDADGFTVGGNDAVNKDGDEYYWIAFQARPGQLVLDTYVGDGNDDRSISGLGFSPEWVLVMPETAKRAIHRTADVSGDTTLYLGDPNPVSNLIQALESDGFQVGADDGANKDGVTYHYAAWNAGPRRMATGTYDGNATDDRDITGAGFTPDYVIVRSDSNQEGVHHPLVLGAATDNSLNFKNNANLADAIQALQPDGFEVGTSNFVNKADTSYFWIAFKSFRRVMNVD